MEYQKALVNFPARLLMPNDKLLEIGKANISAESRSVEFRSDFVQLFKMGTELKIVILKDDIEIQSFVGTVYLSSQNMLRLVDVSDEILPGAKLACQFDVALHGTVYATIQADPPERFRILHRKPEAREMSFPVDIYKLSMHRISFTSDQNMKEGQFIVLESSMPAISRAILEIEHVYEFGQMYNNYQCLLKEIDPVSRGHLDVYVSTLCNLQLKYF